MSVILVLIQISYSLILSDISVLFKDPKIVSLCVFKNVIFALQVLDAGFPS